MVFPKKQRTSVLAMAATTSRFTPAAGPPDEEDFVRMLCYYRSDDGCAQARLQDKVSLDVSDQHQWQNEGKWLLLSAILAATITYQAVLLGQLATDTYPSRRMVVYYYMNAVAFVASLAVIIVLLLIRVGTLRRRHAGIELSLLGVPLALFYAAVWICRQDLTSAIYAAVRVAAALLWGSSSRTAPNQASSLIHVSDQHEEQDVTTALLCATACAFLAASLTFVMVQMRMRYELRNLAFRTTNPMRRYKELFFNHINSVSFVASLVSITHHTAFFYLSSVTFVLSSTAFLNLLRFLAGQPAHTSKSPSTLARVHMARQHRIQRNIQAHIHTLVVTIIETLIKGRTPQYSKCYAMSTQQSLEALQSPRINRLRATPLRKFDEQSNRRCIQIPISGLLGTCKTTRPTISSALLDSGAIIVLIDLIALQGCISTPNKKKAPSDHEHLLDHMLRSAVSGRAHVRQRNLTEECSEKPRSNSSTPATNSSDDTTRDPVVQNKLNPDGQNENHSGPDACVDDRDTSASKAQAVWYMATGAARHATGDSSLITNLVPLERAENGEGLCVHAADGTPMPVLGHGSVVTQNVVLPDVVYVPGLLTNLVSVGQLAGLDYSVGFGRGACVVSSADGETVGRAHAGKDGLYEVEYLRVHLE